MKVLESKRFYISIDTLAVRISNSKESVVIPNDVAESMSLAAALAVAERLLDNKFEIEETELTDNVKMMTIKINKIEVLIEYHEEFGEFLVINLFSR